MAPLTGRVTNVHDHQYGSELDGDHAAGATSLGVIWTNDFDADGGQLYLEDAGGGNQSATIAYTVPVDPDTEIPSETVINLATPLASPYLSGDSVWVSPVKVERWAWFMEPDAEEPLVARVPHQLVPLLSLGQRDIDTAEQIEVEQSGTQLVVSDVLAKPAQGDLSSIQWSTSPDGTGQRVDIDTAGIRLIDAADDVLANLPTDETQTPEFAGHVAADGGIDIVAGTSGAPTDDRKIRWLRASDGAVVATVYGYEEVTGLVGVELRAISQTSTKAGLVNLRAYDSTGSIAELSVQKTDTGGALTNLIEAQVGGAAATFLDGSGASDFEFDTSGGWQDWTPTLTGWSANPTNAVYRYKQIGKMVVVSIRQLTNGTSNATTKTISAPVTAATITNMRWEESCSAADNGVDLATPGRARIPSGSGTISFDKDASAAGGWTASGGHRINACTLIYEAA